MRRRLVIGSLAAVTAAAALAFTPPEITTVEATDNGDGTATVTGAASFPGEGPQSLMDNTFASVTDHQGGDAADALGLQIVDARIERVDEGLKFVWVLNNLPAEVPPELVRYTWSFAVGGQTLQLQAKRTNAVNATTLEDPVGHVQHASEGDVGWFQVRGACQDEYLGTPVSGCYHLDFVDGGFDTDADVVWMIVPFDPHDDLNRPWAPEFVPGATIAEIETAGMSIAASAQAFVSNTLSSSFINGWGSYHIGERVDLASGRSSRPGAYDTRATLQEDGTFSGTVDGLGGSTDTVWARACEGVVCSEVSVTP